ncbi:MAG: hypothetical protein ACRENE_27085, partial [Polyangiaceae bacterium]
LMVADGAHRPCDSSDNQMLFNDHANAGKEIKLVSVSGSVCVDHTYGAFRDSQWWAGASIWSGAARVGLAPAHSTERCPPRNPNGRFFVVQSVLVNQRSGRGRMNAGPVKLVECDAGGHPW